jgi:CHAT domain-containing protein/Tfp pilus assembly protein PilF
MVYSAGAAGGLNSGQVTPQEAMPLELGKPIERELAGGQSHAYQITLAAGQYLNVVIEQRSIDAVVALFGPDGKQIAEYDDEYWNKGQEMVSQVAEASGSYRLEVKPKQKEATVGRYEIRATELRAATEKDRALQESRNLYPESERLSRAGKHDEALALAGRALEIREKALGPEHAAVTRSLNYLASLYEDKRDYAKAEPLYRRALTIQEKMLGPEHAAVTRSLNHLASLYHDKGDYANAEPLYQRALTIMEKTLGPEHPDLATSLHALAVLYIHKRDQAKAEPLLQRALTIQEKTLGPEHPDLAISLNTLASSYIFKGDYAKAELPLQRALTIQEKALEPDHPEVAVILINLAGLYHKKGDYAKAEPYYQRSLTILEKALGMEHPDVTAPLNNLAYLYWNKGDYAKAEPLYQRVLAILEKAQMSEHPNFAATINNLANLYQVKGEYAKAEPLLLRALTIKEKVQGPEHPSVAIALSDLAALYRKKGDYAKAEPLYQRALTIQEKKLGLEHPDVALSLTGLAALYHATSDYAKAEPLYQRALMIRDKKLGPEHPDVTILNNIAMLYEAKGDIAQAIALKSRALQVSERNIALNVAIGSERQKLAYLATVANESSHAVSLHVRSAPTDKAARSLALTTILQRKGRALDMMNDSLTAIRRRASLQDQGLLDQYKDAVAELARLALGGPQGASPAEHQSRIRGLQEQIEKLEAEIGSRCAEFAAQYQPVTLASVQSVVSANAALVEFFAYRPVNVKFTKSDEIVGPPRYATYVLHRQGEARWVDLGEAKAIDEAVDQLRQALRDPQRRDVKQLARKVDQLVMEPLRPLLGSTRQVLLSPDGALNLVPFAALVDERQQYLVNRYSVQYLTSGRDLLRLQVKQESRSEDLVLADPAYGEKEADEKTLAATRDIVKKSQEAKPSAPQLSQSVSMEQVFFRPLPGTAGEAEALKRLLPQARVLTKEQATETALKQATRPHILHIATHGYFLRNLDLPIPNANTGETPRLPELTPGGEKIENPLLRSGLALAGANLRRSGDEDGILTALEASGLNLWGTKLVVLSACDTGVGEVKNGEGVYGLRRALVLAGSETQVMSLWPVSDAATRDLMVDYYRRLQRGEGRGEALRQVQLQMLRNPKRQHPYYWASFIQSGEWASLDGKR